GACERAVQSGWYPCFMANFTTAIGLGSLYLSHLIPIVKFGVYAAIGVLLSLILLFLYLPALLYLFPDKKDVLRESQREQNPDSHHNNVDPEGDDGLIHRFWQYYGKLIIRFHVPISLVCLAAMVYLTYCMFSIQTSVKMMRFYSPNAEIIAHYTALEEMLGPLVPMEVVLKFDNSKCQFNSLERLRFVEEVSKALREKLSEDIGGVMSVATMGPSTKPRGKPGSLNRKTNEWGLNGRIDKYRSELKDYVTVEGDLSLEPTAPDYMNVLQSLQITDSDAARLRNAGINSLKDILARADGVNVHGITAEEMENFKQKAQRWQKENGVDLWRISMRVWSLKKDIDYSKFINNVKDVVNPMVDDFVAKQFPKEQYPKHPPTVEDEKLGVIGKVMYWFRHKCKQIKGLFVAPEEDKFDSQFPVYAVYTGMVPVVYKTQHELIEGLVDSLIGSFTFICFVMMIMLRSPIAGLLAMLPNVFPIVIVFGLLGYFGVLIDVGTMMTASVAMGIAVDDTIHFLTWFRHGIDLGLTPREAILYSYKRSATAICQTTAIAGLGLAAFAFSTFTPTQMFGVMMLALLVTSTMGDLVFLAAVLSGPASRFFVTKKNQSASEPQS
ncbi:MAG: MMPL family transporter, partial [Planctomycetaceae bacterium]|nr:MMPL family transporter [Planctomycetaceae bacterium]